MLSKKEETPIALTLGQLLKIKREKMGLTITEAIKRLNVTNLSAIERDSCIPQTKTITKLIGFYKINNDEMKKLKEPEPAPTLKFKLTNKPNLIENAVDVINELLQKVGKLDGKCVLAASMKSNALQSLLQAKELLIDISIIDRII